MADKVDKAAAEFATAWEKSKNKVNKLYSGITNQNISNSAKTVQVAQLQLTQLFLDDTELQKALAELTVAHAGVLKNLTSFADVDDAFLTALINIDQQVYVGQIGASASEIKALMGESLTANLSEANFAKSLQTTGLQKHQANALANDSLRVYQRNVTAEMANNSDPNKLYIWAGPLDSRTSAACQKMIAAGEQTYRWWKANYGSVIITGTHVNDRHVLQPV